MTQSKNDTFLLYDLLSENVRFKICLPLLNLINLLLNKQEKELLLSWGKKVNDTSTTHKLI